MPVVSPSDVERFVRDYEAHRGTRVDTLLRGYVAAAEILRMFFGSTWVFQHVLGQGDGSPFLRASAESEPDQFKHQDRVIALADVVFNLQGIEGFDGRISRMQRSDLESLVAELEGAKLLAQSAIPFRFVHETGQRGLDYDLEATLDFGPVACETKCKVEATELSVATVRNVLNSARTQLPADRPGIVFIKIPETWARSPIVASVIEGALVSSLGSTGRISAVIFHWEEWAVLAGRGMVRATRFRTAHNARARWSLEHLGQILSPAQANRWRYLMQMVQS